METSSTKNNPATIVKIFDWLKYAIKKEKMLIRKEKRTGFGSPSSHFSGKGTFIVSLDGKVGKSITVTLGAKGTPHI